MDKLEIARGMTARRGWTFRLNEMGEGAQETLTEALECLCPGAEIRYQEEGNLLCVTAPQFMGPLRDLVERIL